VEYAQTTDGSIAMGVRLDRGAAHELVPVRRLQLAADGSGNRTGGADVVNAKFANGNSWHSARNAREFPCHELCDPGLILHNVSDNFTCPFPDRIGRVCRRRDRQERAGPRDA
jgi:hypothetical protein